ncbi:hypothetical protein NDU88_003925 [Pleurodeles waltl]|uniref:Endonuclease/exonuclease/phosphatase domain-containing protein n=1 Tax=Pleurodeles waltl TaxID=8319 RepID=A0AAV7NHY1_PLEWA|nr:hypothetical protein NDU88_003925 [Pleurodeles waltl]
MDKLCRLASVYGPNSNDPEYFSEVWRLIESFGGGTVLWGGDFNVTLDPILDRESSARTQRTSAARVLSAIKDDASLVDLWRMKHPGIREGTCVIYVHNS